jgi:hypothetical protein
MKSKITSLAARVAAQYGLLHQVEAVALAGSQTSAMSDSDSDIDLYVYSVKELTIDERQTVASKFSQQAEIGNCFWEPGDEWIDNQTGIKVDVMFRTIPWIEEQLSRVLERHEASVGYSTCFWHNVLSSQVLFDRNGWFAALQIKARQPYPEELRRAIVAKNFPILRDTFSSYLHQIENAIHRGDLISINHRVAALLASYFDVLFAINRMPHPGEKHLVQIAEKQCKLLLKGMNKQVKKLLKAAAMPGSDIIKHTNLLIDDLDALLHAEGLLELSTNPIYNS